MRAVIFDYGSVLSKPQDEGAIQEMAKVLGLDGERFGEAYWGFRQGYDRGELSAERSWNWVAVHAGVACNPEALRTLVRLDARSWAHPDLEMVGWAKRLKQSGLGIAIV